MFWNENLYNNWEKQFENNQLIPLISPFYYVLQKLLNIPKEYCQVKKMLDIKRRSVNIVRGAIKNCPKKCSHSTYQTVGLHPLVRI
jgi:hypothetical protein